MKPEISCWSCSNLSGCELIQTGKGGLDHDKIIDKGNLGDCEFWVAVDEREAETRASLHDIVGASGLLALNILSRPSLKNLEEEDDMGYVPDFVGMLTGGVTPEERIDQFLFETSDTGEILEENGKRIPRGQLALREYARSEGGPIDQIFPTETGTISFGDFDKVLAKVIRAEKKLGWLTKASKSTTKEKGTKMAIRIRRNKKVATPTSEETAPAEDKTPAKLKEKVEKPATKKTRKTVRKPPKSASEAATTTEEVPAASGVVDQAALEKMVREVVGEALKDPINRIELALESLQKALGSEHKGRSVVDLVLDTSGIMHDVLVTKLNTLILLLQTDESGEIPDDAEIPDQIERAEVDNLLNQEEPRSILEHYLDAEGED